jgi:hypothetical protein
MGMRKCGMKKSPNRIRHRATASAAAASAVSFLLLFGAVSALAAPLAGNTVHSGIGTAITTGSASRSEHTISTAATGKGNDPIGDRVGSRVTT